jgi:TldD protein
MTNTYMLSGQSDPARHHQIGQTRAVRRAIRRRASGHHQRQICFQRSEAYLIEDGKVTAPVKGATLIGNGPVA